MTKMCTALVVGNGGNECRRPVAEGAQISLCALHLLLAAKTVEELGGVQAMAAEARRIA